MLKFAQFQNVFHLPSLLALILALAAGCATPQFQPVFEGSRWRLVDFDGQTLSALGVPTSVELQLDPTTHRVTGTSGVNRIAGTYQIAGKRISFGPVISTRMAGTPEAMKFEADYLNVLGKIDEWSLTDGKLELHAGPQIMATYLPVPPLASGTVVPAQ